MSIWCCKECELIVGNVNCNHFVGTYNCVGSNKSASIM